MIFYSILKNVFYVKRKTVDLQLLQTNGSRKLEMRLELTTPSLRVKCSTD